MMSLQQTFYLIINLGLYSVIDTQILPLLQEYVCFKSCTAIALTIVITIVYSENKWNNDMQLMDNVPRSLKNWMTSLCKQYTKYFTPILAYPEKLNFSSTLSTYTKMTTNVFNKESGLDVISSLNPINGSPSTSDDSADDCKIFGKFKIQSDEGSKIKYKRNKTKNRLAFIQLKKKYGKKIVGHKKLNTSKKCMKNIKPDKSVIDNFIKSTSDVIFKDVKKLHPTYADLHASCSKMNDSIVCIQQNIEQNNIKLNELKELDNELKIIGTSLAWRINKEKEEVQTNFQMFDEKLNEIRAELQQQKDKNLKRFIEREVQLQTLITEKSINNRVTALFKKLKDNYQNDGGMKGIQNTENRTTIQGNRTSGL